MPALPNQDHFTLWILQMQQTVMMLLGKMVNPYTGKADRDLDAARWHIDLLSAVEGRTKGNLEADEERLLTQVLTTLRLNYVQEVGRPEPPAPGNQAAAESPDGTDAAAGPAATPPTDKGASS